MHATYIRPRYLPQLHITTERDNPVQPTSREEMK